MLGRYSRGQYYQLIFCLNQAWTLITLKIFARKKSYVISTKKAIMALGTLSPDDYYWIFKVQKNKSSKGWLFLAQNDCLFFVWNLTKSVNKDTVNVWNLHVQNPDLSKIWKDGWNQMLDWTVLYTMFFLENKTAQAGPEFGFQIYGIFH